ncbi:GIY-YIG nuclease family protein [Achromobacter sp. NPDC058515]|uniref:GIY-YIG nuclease family protein n=1 Tax=Achromobacter sp. NPDC058515 TaxID=3346533 RepID=UPI0036665A0E
MQPELKQLSPLANLIVDRAIDNTNRKLIGGFRNKNHSRPNAKTTQPGSVARDALNATSAQSVMDVANRGVAWRELIEKSLTHGISALTTMKFDGEFSVKDGVATGLDTVPNQPGVYVVYNKDNEVMYVGDSTKMQSRWHAGHLNEFKQGERAQEPYKLADEFKEGCTVKYVVMDSEETAAALEAHLIRTEQPPANKREELLNQQGKRANIEAKKMKDASGTAGSLLRGAATEAAKNSGWVVLEQLTAAALKALKDELVDIFGGGESTILARIQRFCEKVWSVVKRIIEAPLQLLKGIFEFIVNALSKTVRQIYQLARNIFDLGAAAWALFKGAGSMSKAELITKITETIIVSGTLVIWDGLDPIIESQLVPLLGPVAPYLAAAISAIGFGLSSHYLQQFVPSIVEFLVNSRTGHHDALLAQREACLQLITLNEQQFETVNVLGRYVESSLALEIETKAHTRELSQHSAIKPLDIRNLLASSK